MNEVVILNCLNLKMPVNFSSLLWFHLWWFPFFGWPRRGHKRHFSKPIFSLFFYRIAFSHAWTLENGHWLSLMGSNRGLSGSYMSVLYKLGFNETFLSTPLWFLQKTVEPILTAVIPQTNPLKWSEHETRWFIDFPAPYQRQIAGNEAENRFFII